MALDAYLAQKDSPTAPGDVSPASVCQRGAGVFYTQAEAGDNAPVNAGVALIDLADAINAEHQEAEKCAASAVDHARACGSLLLEAKRQMARGEWLPWLEANVTVTARMAQNYMRLSAELAKMSPENAKRVSHLPVRDALRSIAGDAALLARVDPEQRKGVYDAVESGQNPFHAIAAAREDARKRILQEQKPGPTCHAFITDDRPITLTKSKNPCMWMVEVGPNSVGEKFDALAWSRMTRGVMDSDDAVADLRAQLQAAIDTTARLRQALQESQARTDDLNWELRAASYRVLEARHGRPEWGMFATRHFPPAISKALRELETATLKPELAAAIQQALPVAILNMDAELVAECLVDADLLKPEQADFQISDTSVSVECDLHYQCYKVIEARAAAGAA